MKIVIGFLSLVSSLVILTSLRRPVAADRDIEPAVAFFKTGAAGFAEETGRLVVAISAIERTDRGSLQAARDIFKKCRLKYKRIEFFLDYFFTSAALIYNGPAKYEIEEPYMEFQEPIGLQVIEGLLFDKDPYAVKEQLILQAEAINSSAADLGSLLYSFKGDARQLLESLRLHLIKVITLEITGFDAPLLKSGVQEAEVSMGALHYVLAPFLENGSLAAGELDSLFRQAIQFLKDSPGFDGFDRLGFLKRYALPIQQRLGVLIKDLGLEINTSNGVLNYDAADIFSPDALNISAFDTGINVGNKKALVALGRQLFFEPGLSGNNQISCATCHQPEHYFSEPRARSLAFDGHSFVKRNAPSLLYAGYQYKQFWEGRANSLEEQVKTVIMNPEEMNGRDAPAALLARAPDYTNRLKNVFDGSYDTLAVMDKFAYAIAAYIRELNPRSSRFDHYLHGSDTLLSASEQRGFNLFMGKAQCGTCHFAPLFNGLVPPLYNLSEVEVLGTLESDDLGKPRLDSDRGRIEIFPIEFYERAFKTPTVRNVSDTGPYMHNGAFRTLDSVVEFYNKGGAAGLGLAISNQTLSPLPLNLSKEEVKDVVGFLHALKDSININPFEN